MKLTEKLNLLSKLDTTGKRKLTLGAFDGNEWEIVGGRFVEQEVLHMLLKFVNKKNR